MNIRGMGNITGLSPAQQNGVAVADGKQAVAVRPALLHDLSCLTGIQATRALTLHELSPGKQLSAYTALSGPAAEQWFAAQGFTLGK